jgi:elongator complex protein 3
VGEERFLEWVTSDDRLAGFLRLTLPRGDAPLPELAGAALIREVHVYGASLPLGDRADTARQHAGLGRALVEEAARIACEAGYGRIAVISAVGTRPYYRRLGFTEGALYQHRTLRRELLNG